MHRHKFLKLIGLVGVVMLLATLPWGSHHSAYGNDPPATGLTWYANSPNGVNTNGGDSGTAIRKFVDSLPGVSTDGGGTNANNLGQYIPLAVKDTTLGALFPDSDCYKIGIVQFNEQVHSDLPGPVGPITGAGTKFRGYVDIANGATPKPHYLGPLIVAQRDRPVRILFENRLSTGTNGNLFIPVDTTLMGAGEGPLGAAGGNYTQNRAAIHLHGIHGPWISDGTPHQWFTPIGESSTSYLKGDSFENVPDMWFDASGNPVAKGTTGATNNPGAGKATLFYPNQQSGRLMFYHDHASAITRLNVYAGMAAGYLIHDPVEDDLIDGTNTTGVNPGNAKIIPDQGGGVYKWGIPLVIQDKTFVPKNIAYQDNKWNTTTWGAYGDLYIPHIYEPNQSLTDPTGMNPYGRWDFGPWVQPNILAPVEPPATEMKAANALPGTDANNPQNYTTSTVPEAFNDIMMVNGTAYPFLNVNRQAYRFRILNACNDRFLNLQLYLDGSGGGSGATATATVTGGVITSVVVNTAGSGYTRAPAVNITGGGGFGAWLKPVMSGNTVQSLTIMDGGTGYTTAPTITIGSSKEVAMVPAAKYQGNPATWPVDGRDGGVPDPASNGPSFIQIGTEGGFLPGVTVRTNQPVNYDYDRGSATFGNVLNLEGVDPAIKGVTVFLGPAERADVIVDFSGVAAGTNVILYSDAPTPVPGFIPKYDYYTGDPDFASTGGAPQTKVGEGPNTRTIMQFRVQASTAVAFDLAALQTAIPNAYVKAQPAPIVPQTYYPAPYNSASDQHALINNTSLTYKPAGSNLAITKELKQKAIVEVFDQYGRLSANLGAEFFDPTAVPSLFNGIPFNYIDPPIEVFRVGETQIWKITHNGVDTHPVHLHLVNAQIINRVGGDGVVKPPEPYERGWKETIRMNPLEVIYIGLKADMPTLPFTVPYSVRPLNPARPIGSTEGFTNINPLNGQPITPTPTVNSLYNFGYEYVWHCHILGHEENDMMRPLIVKHGSLPPTKIPLQ